MCGENFYGFMFQMLIQPPPSQKFTFLIVIPIDNISWKRGRRTRIHLFSLVYRWNRGPLMNDNNLQEMENVFKLSQNRDEKSYHNIIAQLAKQGGDSALIATEMKKRTEKLFPPGVEWDSKKFLS